MAIHAEKNLYPGINAHLNSFLQNEDGGWQSFHAEHIIDLERAINERLPPGYFTRAEKGLQINETAPSIVHKPPGKITPDVTIYRGASTAGKTSVPELTATPPTAIIPIPDTLTDEDYLTGLVIYQAGEGSPPGRPVTRIELLSPANKPGGSYYGPYVVKRQETLQSGLRLVELDYLHEMPPITRAIASYRDGEEDAYPYNILVSDPRPTLDKGPTYHYGFGVDQVMPVITIPLAGADEMKLDLGVAYNHTFESSTFYPVIVDYALEPVHFERYTAADRECIRRRMRAIGERIQAEG